MKDKGILVSEKHGDNPSVLCCEVCGKDYAIALLGKSPIYYMEESVFNKVFNQISNETDKSKK